MTRSEYGGSAIVSVAVATGFASSVSRFVGRQIYSRANIRSQGCQLRCSRVMSEPRSVPRVAVRDEIQEVRAYLKRQRALDRNDFQAIVEAKTRFAGVRRAPAKQAASRRDVIDGAGTIETSVSEPVTVFAHLRVIFLSNLPSEIVPDTIIFVIRVLRE